MSRASLYERLTAGGWKGRLLLFIGGALTALAVAPFYLWPLLFVGYGVLYLQWLSAAGPRAAFWRGWWWGLGFFLAGLYWISIALTVDLVRFGWMIPFALIGLNGFFALFTALSGWVFKQLISRPAAAHRYGVIAFTLCVFFGELLRAHLFTGFPWNLIGYSWGAYAISAQAAAVIGIYGLTLITPFIAAAPVHYGFRRYIGQQPEGAEQQLPAAFAPAASARTGAAESRAGMHTLLAAVLLAGFLLYGWQRLMHAEVADSRQTVRLVQGNIAQDLKWDPDHMRQALETLVRLSRQEGYEQADLIIWAETAFPFTLSPDSAWLEQLAAMLRPHQLLITGAVTAEGEGDKLQLWNSIVAINAEAELIYRYDKRHLVPFGEFVPLREILPVEKVTPGTVDFSHGTRPPEIPLADSVARALVCYEVIFPSYSGGEAAADWLLNLTNDAWYGHSSGPYQHRDMARFRAIEQGLPMIRVANTGITVAYDPYGRPINQLPFNTRGVIDLTLPLPLSESTLYSSMIRVF